MKHILLFLGLLWLQSQLAWAARPATVVLDIPGMSCGSCPITVRMALKRVTGVEQVQADLDSKSATVVFDPEQATVQALIRATTEAGYPSSLHEPAVGSQ